MKGSPFCLDPWIPFGDEDQCSTLGKYSVCITTVVDTQSHLTWQRYHPGYAMNFDQADSYCDSRSARLPTAAELESLHDSAQAKAPYIDKTAFPTSPNTTFWGSDAAVDFSKADGNPGQYSNSSFFDVRCVLE